MTPLPLCRRLAQNVAALLMALAAAPGWAVFPTPSAFDINGPGGFAAACGALNTNSASQPHVQITSGLFDATSNCAAQVFSGAGSAATPVVSWDSVQATGQASNSLGWVSLDASLNRTFGVGDFPQGRANGGWADQMTVTMSNMQGQSGLLLARLHVSGSLDAELFGGALFDLIVLRNKQGLPDRGLGFDPGSARVNGFQWLQWTKGSLPDGPRVVDETVTLTVPFVYGQSFELGVWGRAVAGTINQIDPGSATVDFGQILTWAGVGGVVVNGQIFTQGFGITSASGIDGTQAVVVPEPGSWALMALGLGAIAWRTRRR